MFASFDQAFMNRPYSNVKKFLFPKKLKKERKYRFDQFRDKFSGSCKEFKLEKVDNIETHEKYEKYKKHKYKTKKSERN